MPALPRKQQAALTFGGDAPQTMSSLEISELTGKRHDHVIRDIRAMLDALKDAPDLGHVREDKDARGYTAMFHLDRELTDTLLTGYSIPLRRKVVARWHELESQVTQPPVALTRMDILKLAMESEEARIKAEAERDHAIATKAQISDRKTATAMATASAKAREVKRLEHALGYSTRHATILQVEKKLKRDFDYHPLRRWCNQQKVTPERVPDKRYGDVVAWPAEAWMAVYGVSLPEIFGE